MYRESVLDQVSQVFQRHGASKISLPWIDSDLDWDSFIPFNDCAHVLFTSGNNLSLPYDLRMSFAKHLPILLSSKSNPSRTQHMLKRYALVHARLIICNHILILW
jgi:histidyl-tRNA synthetase